MQRISLKQGYILLFLFMLVTLVQAACTELADDEAYYWVFSQHLELGYFDHPPMIALFIHLGSLLFDGELGVRFFTVLAAAVTILITINITNKKNLFLTTVLFCGFVGFNVFSFIATPDSPLLLFSALTIFCFKKYLEKDSIVNSLVLGIAISLLLYSKYHGVLLVIGLLLGNLNLFSKKSFYVVFLTSVTLFLPHLIWQYQHDWPSIQYHLFSRNKTEVSFLQSLGFILTALVITTPFLIIHFYKSVSEKKESPLERSLKSVVFFILGFFIFFSFRTVGQTHWFMLLTVPLVVLIHNWLERNQNQISVVTKLSLVSFLVLVAARVHLMINLIPEDSKIKNEFHFNQEWANQVKDLSKGKPVVFTNSYQQASKYMFYTGNLAHTISSMDSRRSQYCFWPYRDMVSQKEVLYIANWEDPRFKTTNSAKQKLYSKTIENFSECSDLQLELLNAEISHQEGEPINIELKTIKIEKNYIPEELKLIVWVYEGKEIISRKYFRLKNDVNTLNHISSITLDPLSAGTYGISCSIQTSWYPGSINSNLLKFKVEH